MKKIFTIIATAAFSCCGLSSLFAQIHFNSPAQQPLQRLTLISQTELGEIPEQTTATGQETIANPFDFIAPLDDRDPFAQESSSPLPAAVSAEKTPISEADPASLPVGRQHGGRTIVETVIDHATVTSLPNAGIGPVMWCETARTPNPVAELLLRDTCNVRALWANYPAQHAAECAHMWATINKHANCGCCSSCGSQAGCNQCQPPVRNRYTGRSSGHSTAAACDACAAQAVAPPTTSASASKAETDRAKARPSNVAFLPIPAMR